MSRKKKESYRSTEKYACVPTQYKQLIDVLGSFCMYYYISVASHGGDHLVAICRDVNEPRLLS